MRDPAALDIGPRLREIRELLSLTLLEMSTLLQERGADVSISSLHRLEKGTEMASLEELGVFAQLDPLTRGRLWLAWGDAPQQGAPKGDPPPRKGAVSDERTRERVQERRDSTRRAR